MLAPAAERDRYSKARNDTKRSMRVDPTSGSGIRVPPPVLYLAALAVGVVLHYLRPLTALPGSSRYVIGGALAIVSILIMPPVLFRFRRAETPFDVRKAASSLITDGPYKFSRNPAYLSLTMLYVGIGVLLNNGWLLILVIPVFLAMDLWVVRREEQHLEAKFGEEFRRYKAAVHRWL
jgi:protein-S-isoprenylcysteine O-methyltransferase Ste14